MTDDGHIVAPNM